MLFSSEGERHKGNQTEENAQRQENKGAKAKGREQRKEIKGEKLEKKTTQENVLVGSAGVILTRRIAVVFRGASWFFPN